MSATMSAPSSPFTAPRSVEETGVRRSLLEDLALKTLYVLGEVSVAELAAHMKLKLAVVNEFVLRLRKDMLCEVTGLAAANYRVQTTSAGKSRAVELLTLNQYVGPAPVSMADYVAQVRQQSGTHLDFHHEDIEHAFAKMVLDESVLTQLGTSLVSGKAIFLYGPPGTGKSTVAETLAEVFRSGNVWVPYAAEINGDIITIFDPAIHQRADVAIDEHEADLRWVLCRRPRVMVGGELTIEMLDLQFNPTTRFYTAPMQMKANNGLLIIDDFGRQRVRPDELLNRWVVPLDRKIDHLTLAGGQKLEVPFDAIIVFATNINPAELVDEAFLRRIQNKVHLGAVLPEQFAEILRRVCVEYGLEYNADVAGELVRLITEKFKQPLRPCYPRDVVQQIRASAQYGRRNPVLDRKSVEEACSNYFIAA